MAWGSRCSNGVEDGGGSLRRQWWRQRPPRSKRRLRFNRRRGVGRTSVRVKRCPRLVPRPGHGRSPADSFRQGYRAQRTTGANCRACCGRSRHAPGAGNRIILPPRKGHVREKKTMDGNSLARVVVTDWEMRFSSIVWFVAKGAIASIVAAMLCACSTPRATDTRATGPQYNELAPTLPPSQPSMARVVVFMVREGATDASHTAPVSIDDTVVADCSNGGFNYFEVTPGSHIIDVMRGPKQTMTGTPTLQAASCPLPVSLAGGETYFYEIRRSHVVHPAPIAFSLPFAIWGLADLAVNVIGSIQGACIGPYSIEAINRSEGLRKIGDLRLTGPLPPPPPYPPRPPKMER